MTSPRRLYAAFFVSLFLKGLAFGVAIPFVAVWLVDELHATPLEVGLARTVAGATALVVSLLAARATDRTRKRRSVILVLLVVEAAAWFAFVRMRSLGAAIAVAAFGNLASTTQILALLADWNAVDEAGSTNVRHNTMRMAFALGWLVGPTIGGFVTRGAHAGTTFLVTGIACGAAAVTVALGLRDAPAKPKTAAHAAPGRLPWLFLAALLCAFAIDGSSRSTLLPVFVTSKLGISAAQYGIVLTCGVLLELPLFPAVGRVADRIGTGPLVMVGLIANAISLAILAGSKGVVGVTIAEIVRVPYVAAIHGTAMVHLQKQMPERVGLAMALYAITFQVGPAVAAPVLGYASTKAGWPPTLVSCAVVLLFAAALTSSRRGCSSA